MSKLRFAITRIGCLVLSGALVLAAAGPVEANEVNSSVSFRVVAWLGDPAPGGGQFLNDFEVGGINDQGQAAFVSDLVPTSPILEGVYLARSGGISALAKAPQPAPGGGTIYFEQGVMSLNNSGLLALPLSLTPDTPQRSMPIGVDVGIYTSRAGSALNPLLVPRVTKANDGQTLLGTVVVSLNNHGDVLFDSYIQTPNGIHIPGQPYSGIGRAVYTSRASDGNDRQDPPSISVVAQPGDPAPDGGTFDFAGAGMINDRGDIVFRAHRAGHPCVTSIPQIFSIQCSDAIYVRHAGAGRVQRVAGMGDPAPGGGTFGFARTPEINAQGWIAFRGTTDPSPTLGSPTGVYLASPEGELRAIVRPGDPMPGGKTLLRVAGGCFGLNDAGEIFFGAELTDGSSGEYLWSHGKVQLLAGTGTVVPGVGTLVDAIGPCDTLQPLNNRGEALIVGTFADGRTALMVASTR